MKKIVFLISLLPIVLILFSCSNKDSSINSAEIDAHMDADGTVHVKEMYNYTFDEPQTKLKRNLDSGIENFEAYTAPDSFKLEDFDAEKLTPLKTEDSGEDFQVTLPSEKNNQIIVYSYDITNAITKYNDVAEFSYDFFQTNNNISDVTINFHLKNTEDSSVFFYSKNQPEINKENGTIQLKMDKVQGNEILDLIMPASELSDRAVDVAESVRNDVLVSNSSLQWRYQNLEDNYNRMIPLIAIGIVILLIGVVIFYRKRITKKTRDLLALIENNDPLLVKYMDKEGKVSEEDLVAGLFSLYQRGLVSIHEVPSERISSTTFRFTWKRSKATLDERDLFLKEWLFTRKDMLGSYCLLESIQASDEPNNSRLAKRDSKKFFKQQIKKWQQLIEEQPTFKKVQTHNLLYYLASFSLVLLTLGLLTYFIFYDVWPREVQYSLTICFTLFGLVVLFFKSKAHFIYAFLGAVFILNIFLFNTWASLLFSVFLILAGLLTNLATRSQLIYGNEIRLAANQAKRLFQKQEYPVGVTPKQIEKEMQLAIIFGKEDLFAEQCATLPSSLFANGNYPIVSNPELLKMTSG